MSDTTDKYQEQLLRQYSPQTSDNEDSDDIQLEELLGDIDDEADNNQFMQRYREKRLQEISDHLKIMRKNIQEEGYGKVQDLDDESQLLKLSANCPRLIVHFMLEQFNMCEYMNSKLEILARKYLTTKFIKINVEKCPFLVEKLRIKVLPLVIGYSDSKERLRLTGFAKLGNDPTGFRIEKLEQLCRNASLLSLGPENNGNENDHSGKFESHPEHNTTDSDLDSDLDI